jgi:hypothetical protein
MTRRGEEMNTDVMKLVKTDVELTADCKALLDALVGKMAEMLARELVTTIGMDNGAESGKVELTMFRVDKRLQNFKAPQPQR